MNLLIMMSFDVISSNLFDCINILLAFYFDYNNHSLMIASILVLICDTSHIQIFFISSLNLCLFILFVYFLYKFISNHKY